MKYSDFEIGTKFSEGPCLWFCTDVGSRVIIAVCLGDGSKERGLRYIDEHGDSVEEVFNVNGMIGCHVLGADNPEPRRLKETTYRKS